MGHNRGIRARLLLSLALSLLLAPLGAAVAAPSSDPYFELQWNLERIEAERAWEVATGEDVKIAVVDTGLDIGHPDFASKVVTYRGSDFVDRDYCGRRSRRCIHDGPVDYNGHGTHVAGIAGALTHNDVGVAGVAPDASIFPVRVLDASGSGTTRAVARGIEFAADHGADVVNLSLGVVSGPDKALRITGKLDPIYDAIDYALSSGAVVVVAAGNDTFPLCSEPSAHPRVLCVGATDRHDLRSWYSNSDATLTSNYLVAPGGRSTDCGTDVYSTFLRWADRRCGEAKGYEALSGTSMAAPHVSGVAALLISQGLGPDRVLRCVVRTADDLGAPGRDPLYGYGRLNAFRAVTGC